MNPEKMKQEILESLDDALEGWRRGAFYLPDDLGPWERLRKLIEIENDSIKILAILIENGDLRKKVALEARLRDALEDMTRQFAYPAECEKGFFLATGGLSALENAFEVLGVPDPWPCPDRKCRREGCNAEGTCGTPTSEGYKWLCGKHAEEERRKG